MPARPTPRTSRGPLSYRPEPGSIPTQPGVYRFRDAQRRVSLEEQRPLTELALSLGYYDQPHLIRDFSRRLGAAPGRYRREGRAIKKLLRSE